MLNKSKKKWLVVIITGFFAFFLSLFLSYTSPFRTLELKSLDFLFEKRGPLDVSESPIVLVAISEQADQEIHERWPWPYRHHARLIDNLNRAGAKAIGFDLIFDQPDRFLPDNDTLFANTIAKHQNVVTSGNILVSRGQTSMVKQLVEPFTLLNDSNPNPWGLISVINDNDGFLRRYALQDAHLNTTYNALVLELLRIYLDLDDLTIEDQGRYFQVGPYTIPKYDQQAMLINYHGGPGTFLQFSYDQIVDDKSFVTVSDEIFFNDEELEDPPYGFFDDPDFGLLHTGDLKDKIILVGSTMPELHDYFSTPFAPRNNMPGFEIHANALQTILDGNYIANSSLLTTNLIILGFSFLAAFITVNAGAVVGTLYILLLAGLYVLLFFYSFLEYSYQLEITCPLLAIAFSFMGAQVFNYITEQKERRRIQGMFGSYVSPVLVKKMVESEQEPNLGGEEVYITALFSDIVSFSAFSEKLPPTQLVDLINEYLTGMTDILSDQGATLDKYIGDAIVSFFGAPVPIKDHAYNSCIASQMMQIKQRELCEKWQSEGDKWPAIVGNMQTRIGINTGDMVTGNMGSTRRFNYTIMGDNVNLAARCESGAKMYGIHTMVTEDTKNEAEKIGNECFFRHLDKIIVMGRTQPVNVYELAGLRSHMSQETQNCMQVFEDGLQAYFKQEWDKAIKCFKVSAKLEPTPHVNSADLNPSLVLMTRCEYFKHNPPNAYWDGTFVMQSK